MLENHIFEKHRKIQVKKANSRVKKNMLEKLKQNKELDFVYIDGNHNYDKVKKDIELYFPKIHKDGVIGGHDFSTKYLGVCKAVIEFAENNGFNVMGNKNNNDWWIQK